MSTPDLRSARQALEVLPGLSWSGWSRPDLPDVSALLTEVERVDDPSERHSLQELTEDFDSSTYHLDRDCLIARDQSGAAVAIARAICTDHDTDPRRVLLAGAVRPDRRAEGIGRAIMSWQLAHGRAWYARHRRPAHGPLRLSVYADSKAAAEHDLAERFGLVGTRYYAELTHRYGDDDIDVPEVAGIEIRPWSASTPQQTLAVRNASFRDHWGAVDRPLRSWVEDLATHSFRPQWSFVAVEGESQEVVAFILSRAYEQDWRAHGYTSGYIDVLGTMREHRGRGVATALIRRAMRAFREAGMDAAEIGVDAENPTGAFALYTALGFTETSATVQYVREESPGS